MITFIKLMIIIISDPVKTLYKYNRKKRKRQFTKYQKDSLIPGIFFI